MKFHGIDMQGKYYLQDKDKDVEAFEERRLIYDSDDEEVYFGNSSQWVALLSNTNFTSDIPTGAIMLFDSNVVVSSSWTLLADQDDDVVYITKGSVAGGETGGTAKSGGTWTQPDHTLITAEMPPHTHNAPPGLSFTSYTGGPVVGPGNNASSFSATASTGGGSPHNHGTSWRPKGRNWTRQQRN